MSLPPTEWLSERLDAIYESYSGFDFRQTTVGVDDEEFEEIADRGDTASVRVRVRGPDGVLALSDDDGWSIPGGVVDSDRPLAAVAADIVRDQTGVRCRINELVRIELTCLRHEHSGGMVYELAALFDGSLVGGEPNAKTVWRDRPLEQTQVL